MAIFGRPEFLPVKQRDSILELAGVRGFGGEFEKSLYVKGVEGKDVAPLSAAANLEKGAGRQASPLRPIRWARSSLINPKVAPPRRERCPRRGQTFVPD